MADYRANAFPEDDATRGRFPMADGLLDYFPNALAAVAEVSKIGNDKHNPGQTMHHARGKSMDHRNKIMRHLCDAGGVDAGGVRHSAYVAWRALALLQEELEREEGAPMARAAKLAAPVADAVMPELRPAPSPLPVAYRRLSDGVSVTAGRRYNVQPDGTIIDDDGDSRPFAGTTHRRSREKVDAWFNREWWEPIYE